MGVKPIPESPATAGGRRHRACLIAAAVLIAAGLLAPAAGGASAADSAVVVMYHRFGEPDLPTGNIRIDQFEAHLRELKSGRSTVMPVPDIIAALKQGKPLPDRTVGITIDDAYLSVYTQAWPRLKAAGLPWTLFVATEPIDRGYKGYMTWDQIRELAADGVTIGNHTAAHAHMTYLSPEQNGEELARTNARFLAELGTLPELFAYPYGEYSLAVREQVVTAGFAAAFGQQSSILYGGADFFALPRFPLNERYGDIKRFRLVTGALPLPVTEVTPVDPLLTVNPPIFGFTVDDGIGGLNRLACYGSAQGKAVLERVGSHRIEVRLSEPFPPGRARINCTMPGPEGRWRWYGIQFFIPES